MKVKIGPYPKRLIASFHTEYMRKHHGWRDWPDPQTRFENFLEWLEDRVQSVYNIINWLYFDRKTQKIKVKIDPWDTWGMDHTLALIIVPMLKQLKDDKHGAPFVDYEDVPEDLRPAQEWYERYSKNGETDPWFFARWEWVMDEMIWAFEQKLDDDWEDQYFEWEDDPEAPLGSKLKSYDKEGHTNHHERMTNGFRLFGKYYEALWD